LQVFLLQSQSSQSQAFLLQDSQSQAFLLQTEETIVSSVFFVSQSPQQAIAENVPIENNSMVTSIFFIFIYGYLNSLLKEFNKEF